jgi:hypothetical protein
MAKYKVDKKLFDERILQEQLKQVELQSKYLKDEPLKRSEVDEYNKLVANGWIKNTLISLGVIFATAVAFVVFILLGNMLMTNGRTGNIKDYNLNSAAIYEAFVQSDYIPEDPAAPPTERLIMNVDYKIPGDLLAQAGGREQDIVYISYRLVWDSGVGDWIVGRDDDGTIGYLTQSVTERWNTNDYQLDSEKIDLNTLMTNWFKGQEDGWAKTMIEDFFYTAWPLTLVLWLVFLLSIAGYAVVLVVGVRYVIRTVIVILRRGGYIASDFVREVFDTVKSEIPIVETEVAEEIDFSEMKSRLEKKIKEEKTNFKPAEEEEEEEQIEVVEEIKPKKQVPVRKKTDEEVEEEPEVKEPSRKMEKEKSGTEKVKDIFDL